MFGVQLVKRICGKPNRAARQVLHEVEQAGFLVTHHRSHRTSEPLGGLFGSVKVFFHVIVRQFALLHKILRQKCFKNPATGDGTERKRYAAPMSGGYFIVVFVSLRLGLLLGLDLFCYEITDVVD